MTIMESFAIGYAAKYILPPIASATATLGMWILAQADGIESWPEIVGGGTIVVAAGAMIFWALRTSKVVESQYLSALEAQAKEIAKLTTGTEKRDDQIDELYTRLRETERAAWDWERKYQQEHDLRVSLERSGLVDRRDHGSGEYPDGG